jgi:hypothetical protein
METLIAKAAAACRKDAPELARKFLAWADGSDRTADACRDAAADIPHFNFPRNPIGTRGDWATACALQAAWATAQAAAANASGDIAARDEWAARAAYWATPIFADDGVCA